MPYLTSMVRSFVAVVSGLWVSLICTVHADQNLQTWPHPDVQRVLEQDYIPVRLDGKVRIPFGIVVYLFGQDDILMQVQEEYARQLPLGETPEFVVQQESDYRWSYVNRRNQHSVIQEVHRELGIDQAELLYHTAGRRFFGDFEAVTHIMLHAMPDDTIRYEVKVYAYPKVALSRFLARHLRLIERYFNEKTDELTDLTVAICRGLIELHAATPSPHVAF